ncbi:hypothetical protein P8452_22022 [Trifolium repens]|nr:hypothetical protein P8452_22022 [Trifolium repens]
MWVNTYDWKCMYVCCGLLHMIGYVCMLLGWFTYAREVCICRISIHGESYAQALLVRSGGSGLRGVVAGVDPPDSYRISRERLTEACRDDGLGRGDDGGCSRPH